MVAVNLETSVTKSSPKPIESADYQALLATAQGDDKALIYLMLNGAYYLAEAISLRWSDIKNGCIVTNRKKTGKCVRVAVLWPETLAALRPLTEAALSSDTPARKSSTGVPSSPFRPQWIF